VWRGSLPESGKATPMSYRLASGEQFVAIAVGSPAVAAGSLAAERKTVVAVPKAAGAAPALRSAMALKAVAGA
jgi:glucose dehydrogenase